MQEGVCGVLHSVCDLVVGFLDEPTRFRRARDSVRRLCQQGTTGSCIYGKRLRMHLGTSQKFTLGGWNFTLSRLCGRGLSTFFHGEFTE